MLRYDESMTRSIIVSENLCMVCVDFDTIIVVIIAIHIVIISI